MTTMGESRMVAPEGPPLAPSEMAVAARSHSTYRQILSSSAWIGGSQVINIAIGIVRTKAIAVMLGPAGFGLMGMLTAIADLARSVSQMGINCSGVRQVAEAAGARRRRGWATWS